MANTSTYDAIAREYRESKQLPFRIHVEAYTLHTLLGDVRGLAVLDLACGEGIYSRLLRKAGAARVVGVDLSPAMIELAREAEDQQPLGCEYLVGDAANLDFPGAFDVVLGSYLLNYAESVEKLRQFAATIFASLKPGGRFVGINDNPAQNPANYPLCEPYGFSKSTASNRVEGDRITYSIRCADGGSFQFDNYYLHPDTIAATFDAAGFTRFSWEGPWLAPGSEAAFAPRYWTNFLSDPPVIGVRAERA